LLLTGRPGTGKTHLACAIVADVLNQGYTALYARVPKLLIALRESMRMDSYERPSAILDRHTSPTLLVLDEYGVNTSSDIDYQWLFTIIDTRYQHNLPTVLISNIDAQKIEEELHERIMERIKGSTGITVTFDWSSERSKGNA
jgi:DNA replication protein DnaC